MPICLSFASKERLFNVVYGSHFYTSHTESSSASLR
ncbi:unnamed protein product [Brassica oleracea]|uniref:Uncharacterized protein n=1 Tax=Brassica oleracea TaxID=3712 RepID=A0A3P6EJR4_BRAOL|nr:unnamed protein product [Brassica oleracea]